MSAKTERANAAYEQITAVFTAVGRPMTIQELAEHPMIRPLNAGVRSLAQWLITMRAKKLVVRKGAGKRAVYALAVPAERKSRAHPASDSVVIRITKEGVFRAVQPPAGLAVVVEIVA